jgi:uncharacterized protein
MTHGTQESRSPRWGCARRWWLASMVTVLLAGVALAGEISVSGSGVVWAEPDQAQLQVGWTGTQPEVGEALDEANARIEAVRAALAAAGVDPQDVRTTVFTVWRDERWDGGAEPRLLGYRVSHQLQVRVRDVAAAGRLIAAAVDAGANTVGGVTFSVAETTELERGAREAAYRAARQRAEELASLAGLTLGAPTSIEEVSRGAPVAVERAVATLDAIAPVTGGLLAVEVTLRVTFATSE